MIETMKRVSLVFPAKHKERALRQLQEVGLMHLDQPQELPRQDWALGLSQATRALALFDPELPVKGPWYPKEGKARMLRILQLEKRLLVTRQKIQLNQREAEAVLPFGGFSLESIAALKEAGWGLSLYRLREKDLALIDQEEYWFPLFEENHQKVIALFSPAQNPYPNINRRRLPHHNWEELQTIIAEEKARETKMRRELDHLLTESAPILAYKRELENNQNFEKAQLILGAAEGLGYIRGYCPISLLPGLEALAKRGNYALLEEEADPSLAPTKLKQNRFSELFRPILNFIGVLPGYSEPEGGGVFMVFFAVFFAMLVGDAGYGLVMLFGTLAYKGLAKNTPAQIVPLFILLALTTTAWGAVTGLWFGVKEALAIQVLAAMVIPELSAWAADSTGLVIRLCFLIGLGQLGLAHLWQMVRLQSWYAKGAELGWFLLVFALYYLALYFVLGEAMPHFVMPLIELSLALVLIFSEQGQGRSFIKGLGWGLAQFPVNLLNAISNFSDLVSYIRLFAVGLATQQMAVTFNGLALSLGTESIWAWAGMILILLLGHSVNIMLAAIAVMVHAIRLNFLEFSKHLGLQWTGQAYAPFKMLQGHFRGLPGR
ncbi:MAG: hypothetical protein A2527_00390 [Candidatus Lambdaproteobacteria bacterium RIFOXYD2_FULL_50_16]|uniref:V-type ATP synthase subunit I n=1 Tax=Candidatus Lambdaproteobacteria bacterium RIFOXYD2_FULL_50_16 TaxID=1817772 RepID=A0A1F6GFI5_9PROT|nr:MAG: hypothetical protein A2527_00390 [Candidatus Lambdaproteobacteria bacterium RIFOXYD2_FULL_50_16]